jgi:hypothetical protein
MASVDLESLLLSGPRTARELALALGVSQPTVSRRLAEQGERVLAIGQARARRYAWRRPVRDMGWEWPVYRVDGEGGVSLAGRLHAIYPAGYAWRDELSQQESVFDGLPWFLADNRPQGYLGRQLVGLHRLSGLSDRLNAWGDDDILYSLTCLGLDLPGNLLIGDVAASGFQGQNSLFQSFVDDKTLISREELRGLYPVLIHRSRRSEQVNSSMGGEQPKLAECIREDQGLVELLIKYSPPVNQDAGIRWSDMLVAEHLALMTLSDWKIPAAASLIYQTAGRAFLEVTRFDRTLQHGRTGIVSLEAVSGEFIGRSGGWDEQAVVLLEQGRISPVDYDHILRIHAFGSLIANTDMHPGNLSFFLGDDFSLRLAPVYDMLPMHHAPNTHGEVIDRPVRLSRPTPLTEPVWPEVRGWALDYWRRVADDNRISDDFRRLAEAYHAALSRQTEFS